MNKKQQRRHTNRMILMCSDCCEWFGNVLLMFFQWDRTRSLALSLSLSSPTSWFGCFSYCLFIALSGISKKRRQCAKRASESPCVYWISRYIRVKLSSSHLKRVCVHSLSHSHLCFVDVYTRLCTYAGELWTRKCRAIAAHTHTHTF